MINDPNLQFIREKISQIRTAVMYSMSNSPVKLPCDVVTLVKIDEQANLWVLSRQPNHLPDQCEQQFPARLRFYRKGIDFFVEVSGKAYVVRNSYQGQGSHNPNETVANQKPMLIRMSMINIEYKEPPMEGSPSRFENLCKNAYRWFLKHASVSRTAGPIFSKLHKN